MNEYLSGGDLIIIVNAPCDCLQRIVIERLWTTNLNDLHLGHHHLTPERAP